MIIWKKLGILVFTFCMASFSFMHASSAQGLGKLEITHLTGDFYVFTTYQLYKGTAFPSNGLYVNTDAGVIMIDTPWDTTQFQPLLDSIQQRHRKNVVVCVATHAHDDRIAGLKFYASKGIETYTSKMTDDFSKEKRGVRAQYTFRSDTVFKVGQHSFQAYYGGPGHTSDNIVIWFDQLRLLYGGCLVKSVEATTLGNVADANVSAWPQTIRNIKQKFGIPAYVIPGHQDWRSPDALEHTLKLLQGQTNSSKQ